MTAFTRRHRRQSVLYWEALEADDYGNSQVKEAVVIKVRWEWRTETEQDDFGEVVKTDANVVVDRKIPEGSLMWLRPSSSGECVVDPTTLPEGETVYQVYKYFGTDTLDQNPNRTRHRVRLIRYKDSLPNVVSTAGSGC